MKVGKFFMNTIKNNIYMEKIKAYKARLNCGAITIMSKDWHISKKTAEEDAMSVYNSFLHKDRIVIKEVGYDEIEVKE